MRHVVCPCPGSLNRHQDKRLGGEMNGCKKRHPAIRPPIPFVNEVRPTLVIVAIEHPTKTAEN